MQYLGQKKQKKKVHRTLSSLIAVCSTHCVLVMQVLKPSEKFKFSFDWDMGDDTSRDLNPLYQDRPDTALLFGRGRRAGIDLREQQSQTPFTISWWKRDWRNKRGNARQRRRSESVLGLRLLRPRRRQGRRQEGRR